MKRKNLSDLYVVGETVRVEAGDEFDEVWVQRLNPIDNEKALRRATAARTRMKSLFRDTDSDEYLQSVGEMDDYATEQVLIDLIILDDMAEKRASVEAELGSQEEWSDDNYLQGLFDLWAGDADNPGLSETYATDPEDPEALRVFNELKRFNDEANKQVEQWREKLVNDLKTQPREQLLPKAVEVYLDRKANAAFMDEFEKHQLALAVRRAEDHKVKYFDSAADLDDLHPNVLNQLKAALEKISLDPSEGKDSPATPDSSLSSEQQDPEETPASSGPADAAA